MKKVILKSLTLTNFKGEKERTTIFNADVTTISGGNGLGKSRHFDAFIWLLFGKDKQDRKDYEVKTRVNGEELHKVECSVTGVLDVDGETITLKRAFIEDWVKPRGQVEQKFKGNHTECWWNDTPVNIGEYDKRVKGIVDSSVFKMITNPAFFVNMKWQLQREQLFQLAGTVDDADIASQNPDFAVLLDKISGKSLADFKTELAARKKRLKGELEQIQPSINATHKMKPESEDFTALEAELADLDKQIADVEESINDTTARIRKSYEAEQARQREINNKKMELQSISLNARQAAKQKAFDNNAQRRELESNISFKKRELESAKREVERTTKEIQTVNGYITADKEKQEALRKAWFAENAKLFNGETTCPHCGQPLPPDKIAQAQQIFADDKLKKCNEITEQGKAIGGKIADLEKHIEGVKADKASAEEKVKNLADELAMMNERLASMPEAVEEAVDLATIPEYATKKKEIADLEAQVSTDNTGLDTSEFQSKKKALNEQRDEIITRLAKREQIAKADKEIADLEKRGKELGQQIADCEREEYTIQQFTKTKIEECEKRINGLFTVVTFRLFDYTNDGNPVETCVPLIDGVPYGSANTASQVNAGLDIINALCEFNGICAPIFIDGRESVNKIIPTESQIINLVVTKDKVLTIK